LCQTCSDFLLSTRVCAPTALGSLHAGEGSEASNSNSITSVQQCPIDCVVPPWTSVTSETKSHVHSEKLPDGLSSRYKYLSSLPHLGAGRTVTCNTCSATCGGGTKKCSRVPLTVAQHGGKECARDQLTKEYACSWNKCPVSCTVSPWRWLQSGNLFPTASGSSVGHGAGMHCIMRILSMHCTMRVLSMHCTVLILSMHCTILPSCRQHV
jgi:hypothetical protein